MAKKTEKDIEIVPSMMDKIHGMDDREKAVLLGEDPKAQPREDDFRKALGKMMPLTEKNLENFLSIAAHHDLRFTQAWVIFQNMTYEKP